MDLDPGRTLTYVALALALGADDVAQAFAVARHVPLGVQHDPELVAAWIRDYANAVF